MLSAWQAETTESTPVAGVRVGVCSLRALEEIAITSNAGGPPNRAALLLTTSLKRYVVRDGLGLRHVLCFPLFVGRRIELRMGLL